MGRFLLVVTWIPSALLSIFGSIMLLHIITHVNGGRMLVRVQAQTLVNSNEYRFFAALPQVLGAFTSTINTGDARPEIIRTFFSRYKSPLTEHAHYIVEIADKYDLDYRLIPAIAMQESTGCKYIPEDSFNCWGWGIYGDKVLKFPNYKEGIETVSRGLKNNYIDKGLTSPEEIMRRYTPPSKGSWAEGVNFFFEQLL